MYLLWTKLLFKWSMKPGQLSEGHWVKQICEFNFFSVKFFKIVQFFSHFCFLRLFANFWEPGVHSYHFYYVQSNFFVALFLSIKAKRTIGLLNYVRNFLNKLIFFLAQCKSRREFCSLFRQWFMFIAKPQLTHSFCATQNVSWLCWLFFSHRAQYFQVQIYTTQQRDETYYLNKNNSKIVILGFPFVMKKVFQRVLWVAYFRSYFL